MNFTDIIELDVSAEALILNTTSEDINSIIKIKENEIPQLKIKKEAILFFTVHDNIENPIKPEFTINIYTVNNYLIEFILESDNIEKLKELKEYIVSILI
ncbi:hypothetical protein [Caminibacter sp.]